MSYATGAAKTLIALALLSILVAQVSVPLVKSLKTLRNGGIEQFHFAYKLGITPDHKYIIVNLTLHYNGSLRIDCLRVYSPELQLNASFGAIPGPGTYYTVTEVPATIGNAVRLIQKNFTIIIQGAILNGYVPFNFTVPARVVTHWLGQVGSAA